MYMSTNVKLTVWHNWLNYMSAFNLGYAHTNPDTYFLHNLALRLHETSECSH